MSIDLLTFDPLLLASVLGAMFLFALTYMGYQSWAERRARSEVKTRLDIKKKARQQKAEKASEKATQKVAKTMAKKTNEFYSNADPTNMRKLQMRLIQAGFLNPSAVGFFLAARVGFGVLGLCAGAVLALFTYSDWTMVNRTLLVMCCAFGGYFAPNFYINSRFKKLQTINRQGFPDVMDLMVVAAEAGLTTEASIERISKEIARTYPTLSEQLNIVSLEVRAGRPLDQALKSFGDRLGLEEIQGFSTMIQQAKELGTSVSDALRVFSEEMRHKRMMKAEEKAYALPVKLSVPVTVFILPIVIGVAVTPAAIRLMYQ